jgi:hypothetical protein
MGRFAPIAPYLSAMSVAFSKNLERILPGGEFFAAVWSMGRTAAAWIALPGERISPTNAARWLADA